LKGNWEESIDPQLSKPPIVKESFFASQLGIKYFPYQSESIERQVIKQPYFPIVFPLLPKKTLAQHGSLWLKIFIIFDKLKM
jgi:hypothetical protein